MTNSLGGEGRVIYWWEQNTQNIETNGYTWLLTSASLLLQFVLHNTSCNDTNSQLMILLSNRYIRKMRKITWWTNTATTNDADCSQLSQIQILTFYHVAPIYYYIIQLVKQYLDNFC